jgi:hypothetical protein
LDSIIAKELNGKFPPIALLLGEEKPEGALQPKPGQHGCIMPYVSRVIAEGKTAVFDRETCCCTGSITGLGFGNRYYDDMPGGADFFAAFFSSGLDSAKDPEQYRTVCARMPPHERRKFEIGERAFSSPERALRWITEFLPVYDFPQHYRIFKPLASVGAAETVQSVIFTVNPLELTALVTLDGSLRDGVNYTVTPQSSSCQMLGAQVFRQNESETPHAVLGLLDLASRIYTRKWIPDEYLTYAVPWKLFVALEEQAKNGVFQSPIWLDLQEKQGT